MYLYVGICTLVCIQQRPEEGFWSCKAGVIGYCEPSMWVLGKEVRLSSRVVGSFEHSRLLYLLNCWAVFHIFTYIRWLGTKIALVFCYNRIETIYFARVYLSGEYATMCMWWSVDSLRESVSSFSTIWILRIEPLPPDLAPSTPTC